MQSLDKYLTEDYPFDIRDVREIESLLVQLIPTFVKQFNQATAWPYAVTAAKQDQTGFSTSTTAMVLDSLLRLCGLFKGPGQLKSNIADLLDKDLHKTVQDLIVAATNLLLQKIHDERNGLVKTMSSTFGEEDVFTHAWLAEISVANWPVIGTGTFGTETAAKWQHISKCLAMKAQRRQTNCPTYDTEESLRPLFQPTGSDDARPLPHAFAPLRLVQTLRRLNCKGECFVGYFKYFERVLHEQLSFSSIPDSRFDPAELMFCLEGMLLCQRTLVDRSVFDRVLSVLTSVQHDNASWRPVKPFLATDRGLALFPVSVEVANSLLRACELYDGSHLHDTYGSKCISLLRRYWQWLRARAVRMSVASGEYVGWHSEHVNETSVIHSWETSQVMGFLLQYRKALQTHIARMTLIRSRFHCKYHGTKEWQGLEDTYEPVSALGQSLQVYSRIRTDFIRPHLNMNVKDKNYSMLLYGPPGTGKTTVAESIAHALNRNLITITVSDFLAGGEAQMEARAKNIFDVLMAQPPCVVLFDEIDNFLLDRDTPRYSSQDSVFQFMTPGMLTKLNDLRRAERPIFIIATNYEDRIDPAIKRTGRVDFKYLLLPPDLKKRQQILQDLTTESNTDGASHLFGVPLAEADPAETLAKASLFLGYKDIEAAVKQLRQVEVPRVEMLADLLKGRARTISLQAYTSRFIDGSGRPLEAAKAPIAEFLCLVALVLETGNTFQEKEVDAVKAAAAVLRNGNPGVEITAALIRDAVKPHLEDFGEQLANAMMRVL